MATTHLLDLKKIRKQLIADHNLVRAWHCAGLLTADNGLTKLAQNLAERLAEQNNLEHTRSIYKKHPVGENIFCAPFSAKKLQDIVISATRYWYKQVETFDFSNPETKCRECWHFTQLVWKASKRVGFGIAHGFDDHVYVVAMYFPTGNIIGYVAENVSGPKNGQPLPFPEPPKPLLSILPADDDDDINLLMRDPIRKEIRRDMKEQMVEGQRVCITTIAEKNYYADGTIRNTSRTQTESIS